jgi:hypothetical protein
MACACISVYYLAGTNMRIFMAGAFQNTRKEGVYAKSETAASNEGRFVDFADFKNRQTRA